MRIFPPPSATITALLRLQGATALRVVVFASLSASTVAWAIPIQRSTALLRVVSPFVQRRASASMSAASSAKLPGCARADVWLRDRSIEFTIVQQEQATEKCRDSAAERGGNHCTYARRTSYHCPLSLAFCRAEGALKVFHHLTNVFIPMHTPNCSFPQFLCARS